MKITKKNNNQTPTFGILNPGDIFSYSSEDGIFMKINTYYGEDGVGNAVSLTNFYLVFSVKIKKLFITVLRN